MPATQKKIQGQEYEIKGIFNQFQLKNFYIKEFKNRTHQRKNNVL